MVISLTELLKSASEEFFTITGNHIFIFDDNHIGVDTIEFRKMKSQEKIEYFTKIKDEKVDEIGKARLNFVKKYKTLSYYFTKKEDLQKLENFYRDCLKYSGRLAIYMEKQFKKSDLDLKIADATNPIIKENLQQELSLIYNNHIFIDPKTEEDDFKKFEKDFNNVIKIIKNKIHKG